jgi:hypothetical protein
LVIGHHSSISALWKAKAPAIATAIDFIAVSSVPGPSLTGDENDTQFRMSGSTDRSRPTTQAADGLPRWRWTVAEIEHLATEGYFRDEERFELVGGEIVPMSSKGHRHEIIRHELAFRFSRAAPDGILAASPVQFNLAEDTFAVPDVLVHRSHIKTPDARGGDALLVLEIADASPAYDLRTKAQLYALPWCA